MPLSGSGGAADRVTPLVRRRIVARMALPAQLRGCVLTGLTALTVAGCGLLPVGEGSCALHVLRQEGDVIEEIAAPYAVDMVPPGIEADPVAITFGGEGWRQVDVIVFAPDSSVDQVFRGAGNEMNRTEFAAFPVDVPGTWRFRLSDSLAGCAREISVEIRLAA